MVKLVVDGPVGGTMMFRGRKYVLPFDKEVSAGRERERIDVALPDGDTRTLWLQLDRPQRVAVATGATASTASATP